MKIIMTLLKKRDIIYISLIVLLLCGGYFTIKYAQNQRDEKVRYRANYTTLKNVMTYYETKDGHAYGKSGVLELKKNEIDDSIRSVLRALGVKPKNTKTIIIDCTKTVDHFRVHVKDSFIYDTQRVEIANYHDAWTNFKWVKYYDKDSADVNYETNLKLFQAIYVEKKSWNIFKKEWWQPRPINQVITWDNPRAKVTYSKIIEIQKK